MIECKLVRHSDLFSLTGICVDTSNKGQVKLPEVDAWGWYQETFEQRLYKGERGWVKEVINVANLSTRLLKMGRYSVSSGVKHERIAYARCLGRFEEELHKFP